MQFGLSTHLAKGNLELTIESGHSGYSCSVNYFFLIVSVSSQILERKL